ncbi:MAG: sigma 54-interacting transcriptional regulator, partial [Azoarcus sp.]|nr:sigma 54-interacting transcriptional regulator [Azoarcus sp.]
DEIGDLPIAMQVKLLRVIQERQVVRLGSRRPLDIDVRLVTATNIDLARAVEAGNFRRDLYYRLNVAIVDLPSLRERPGDIWPLARHFMETYRVKLRLDKADISPEARQMLMDYEWPGNIRELENVIHYALIVSKNGFVQSGDLRLHSPPAPILAAVAAGVHGANGGEKGSTSLLPAAIRNLFDTGHPAIYAHMEEILVRQAFARCNGNQVKTAALLGISRNVVRALLKRFGLLNGAGQQAAD